MKKKRGKTRLLFFIATLLVAYPCIFCKFQKETSVQEKANESAMEIPITQLGTEFAFIPITIDGKEIFLCIDTGSGGTITIAKKLSNHFNLQHTDVVKSFLSAKGVVYHSEEVLLPNVLIGKYNMGLVIGDEDSKWLDDQVEHDPFSPIKNGIVGRGLFKEFRMILDMKNKKLVLAKTKEALSRIGYSVDEWPSIPFTCTNSGIILNAKMNGKTASLALDSGANCSTLRKTFLNQNEEGDQIDSGNIESFQICGYQMYDAPFMLYNFPQPSGIDGILGMDFINDFTIYIDFQEKIIHIKK